MSQLRVVKRKVTGFFKKDDIPKIRQVILVLHKAMVRSSMLVRALYIYKLSQNDILQINEELFRTACNVVCGSKLSKKIKDTIKIDNFKQLKNIYLDIYGDSKYVNTYKLSFSQIRNYSVRNLMTAYENNITMRFLKYPKRYILCDLLSKDVSLQTARNTAWRVTEYFYNDKQINVTEDEKTSYAFLFPTNKSFPKPRCYDIEANPWDYLERMVKINQMLQTDFMNVEEKYRKLLNLLPFHSSNIQLHIRLDTPAISQLLIEDVNEFVKFCNVTFPRDVIDIKGKEGLSASFQKVFKREPKDENEEKVYKDTFWDYLTNVKNCKQLKAFKKTEWSFDNSILTDGVSISLQIARKVHNNSREVSKEVTITEKTKLLSCDPGKHDIAFLTDGIKTLKYTKGTRAKETYQKARTNHTLKQRKKHGIEEFETEVLSFVCKKSCNYETFKEYMQLRETKIEDTSKCYEKPLFRQFKYLLYVKKKSSEDKFANKILETFTDSNYEEKNNTLPVMKTFAKRQVTLKNDFLIGWGDWGKNPNSLKGIESTPGIGFRRSMERYYKTTTIKEHYTSKTCPCCGQVTLENPIVGKKQLSKHHLLRCRNEKCYSRWWNRNVVGSYNIYYNMLVELKMVDENETSSLET
jgi:Putative transposase DNA-binding domain